MEVPDRAQDVLSPDERVLFVSKQKGSMFKPDLTKRLMPDTLIVTDKRILKFHPKGLVRGALGMSNFTDFTYTEMTNITIDRGAFRSTLEIVPRGGGKSIPIKDIPKDDAAEAFQIIRAQLSRIQGGQPTTAVGTREVVREVVMIPCRNCGTLMPQTTTTCPNCGARRTV